MMFTHKCKTTSGAMLGWFYQTKSRGPHLTIILSYLEILYPRYIIMGWGRAWTHLSCKCILVVSRIGISLMACSLGIDSHEHCAVCSGKAIKYKPFRWYRSKAWNLTVCARNIREEPELLTPNVQFISWKLIEIVALISLGAESPL